MSLPSTLSDRLAAALRAEGIDDALAVVTPAADTRFGDFQTNAAMVAAKALKKNPREVAASILDQLKVEDLCEPPTVAGAGFINFKMLDRALSEAVNFVRNDKHLGVESLQKPKTIIIDFSSPNVAKPMHVGHIRSTILGDSLARIASHLGHHVITDNHIGDWGTQFGKVIYGWKHLLNREALDQTPIDELVRLYREVNALEENDPALKEIVRHELVKLQQGDVENLEIWKQAVALSWKEFERLYGLLDITFDERLGESFYNDALAPLVDRLLAGGIAQVSEGAVCIFFPDIPALEEKPCLIRKSDGGFLYGTTDLATLEYREQRWKPDAIWYVTGAPQQLHFEQVFAAGRRMGITTDLRHIAFGSILGQDRKMMKTRSGENVELGGLLHEAMERALAVVVEKNPDLPKAEQEEIARLIGLGAVKYADLMQHRLTDYVFSWEKMLSFQGNTAPYLQNAYVRIRSIFRKAEAEGISLESAPIVIADSAERALALQILKFGEVLHAVLDDQRPNLLCLYLYEVANAFHSFYEACPILKSEDPVRSSRLALAGITAELLKSGLSLLGIGVPERM
ncbi:MAG: arginine--tRNA ligase [Chthoniobacterales bacterium]|nr:arginine--tRNA ligase [Chthoniobacterales bacterium]